MLEITLGCLFVAVSQIIEDASSWKTTCVRLLANGVILVMMLAYPPLLHHPVDDVIWHANHLKALVN